MQILIKLHLVSLLFRDSEMAMHVVDRCSIGVLNTLPICSNCIQSYPIGMLLTVDCEHRELDF